MGVFLQNALFPGCDEASARRAVEAAAGMPGFSIDLERCCYAHSFEGTQVLLEGELGFAPLARALAEAAVNPVMLLYIYDDDYWGYDFYGGKEEDHFSTFPDYFGPVSPEEKQRLAGDPAALTGWFPTWDAAAIGRYCVHWSDLEQDTLAGNVKAHDGDQFPYGDCWQMTDFAARLGFPWPYDGIEGGPEAGPALPTLREFLEQEELPLPDRLPEGFGLAVKLPTSLSPAYIRELLKEDGIPPFHFEERTLPEITEAVREYRWSVSFPECDHLCQRLAVLAAFCAFWQGQGNAWGFLDYASYEPLYGSFEKPTDVCMLRARAALADYSKSHRACKDLKRLMELDPANRELYRAEIVRWNNEERMRRERSQPQLRQSIQQFEEKKRLEAEKADKRLQLILEKRRKGKK